MSMNSTPSGAEYLDLLRMFLELKGMIKLLIPRKASVSYLAESTGKTNEAVRQFLINNYEMDRDFWKEGGKIMVSQETAVAILMRSSK